MKNFLFVCSFPPMPSLSALRHSKYDSLFDQRSSKLLKEKRNRDLSQTSSTTTSSSSSTSSRFFSISRYSAPKLRASPYMKRKYPLDYKVERSHSATRNHRKHKTSTSPTIPSEGLADSAASKIATISLSPSPTDDNSRRSDDWYAVKCDRDDEVRGRRRSKPDQYFSRRSDKYRDDYRYSSHGSSSPYHRTYRRNSSSSSSSSFSRSPSPPLHRYRKEFKCYRSPTPSPSPSPSRIRRKRQKRDDSSSESTPVGTDGSNSTISDREVLRVESVSPEVVRFERDPKFSYLPIEFWDRSEACREAKSRHVAKIDALCESREQLVLDTTLWKEDPTMEPNMFPYHTPVGVEHYTLWSRKELTKPEVIQFVDQWLNTHFPHVQRWQYDDNLGDRSIELFHVHVFIEMIPFSFTPEPGKEHLPPHMMPPATN